MNIPKTYYTNDTIYRGITNDIKNGILASGFMFKPDASYSETLRFEHYGAFYLLSGRGFYQDEQGQKIPLYPGDYVQRLPDVPHSTVISPTGDWLEFFVCFGADTYHHLADLDLLSREPVIHPGLSPILFQKCIYLLDCMKNWPNDRQPNLYLNLQEFAMELYQRSLHKQMNPQTQLQMQKASELLCTPPDFKSAQEVAEMLDMSYENFRKKFKQYFRSSPAAYQLTRRINYSKTLLLDTSKTLNEIALICHFSDAFAYSKAFKKQYGISPSIFRMMYLT
ncbi:MAG: helix-turn-helix domain-containing protein [Clostridiales bacterium]|nr:helix-turn-helix domain-containing protein [Clostridiales bacterium]